MSNTITDFFKSFKNIYNLIESESLNLIDKFANIKPEIFKHEPLKSFYSKDSISTLKLIIFSILFGILLFKSGKMILSLYNNSQWTSIAKILIRAILVIIIATNSEYILEEIVNVNYLYSETITAFLKDIAKEDICYDTLTKQVPTLEEILKEKYEVNFKDYSKFVSCILLLSLISIFSIRYVIIILYLILFPFLITLFLLNNGEYIFLKTFKVFLCNLLIQNINIVILFIPIISKNEESFEIILLGALFILYKINKSVINIGDIWKK